MTPQEQQLLEDFLRQLVEVTGVAKDAAADRLIANAVARQPDAAYLLVQRALLLGQALDGAQARIARLEAEARGTEQPAAGFLDATSWGRRSAPSGASAAGVSSAGAAVARSVTGAPLPPPAAVGGAPVTPAAAARAGGGSFLGNAAAAAAGALGGAFLFQGINRLMHGGADAPSQGAQAAPLPIESAAATDLPVYDDASFDTAFDDGGGDDDFT